MRITKITLNNLASIEGLVEIDFDVEPLQSTGIFAISGPTGSGKSTILDALCLALYDKTPRFEATSEKLRLQDVGESVIGQDDVRNILRRGTGSGYAEVEFVAVDDLRYRSRWSVRRAHNSPTGSLQSQVIEVYNIDHDSDLQGTKTELLAQLERLLGLSYTQFTRTVLLAQNDFATFLKSKESDKAELLEKLTGTEIYSQISMGVFQRFRKEQSELNNLSIGMETVKLLTDEESAVAQKSKASLEKGIAEDKKKQEKSKKIAEQLVRQKQLLTQFAEKNKLLIESKKLVEQNEQEIAQHLMAVKEFEQKCKDNQSKIDAAVALDALLKASDLDLKERNKKVEQLKKVTSETGKALETSITEYTKLDAALTQYAEQLTEAGEEKMSYDKLVSNLSTQLNTLETQRTALDKQLLELNKEKIDNDLQKVNQDKTKLQELVNALKEKNRLSKESENLTKRINELNEGSVKFKKEQAENAKLLEVKKIELKTTDELYKEASLQLSKDLTQLRANLKSNEACPLCGSKSHDLENIYGENVLASFESNVKKLSDEVARLRDKHTALTTNIDHSEKQYTELTESLKTKAKELETLLEQYKEEELAEEFLSERRLTLQELEKGVLFRNKTYQEVLAEREKVFKTIDRTRTKRDDIEKQLRALEDKRKECEVNKKTNDTSVAQYTEEVKEYTKKETEHSEQLNKRKALFNMPIEEVKRRIDAHTKKYKERGEALSEFKNEQNKVASKLDGEISQLSISLKELKEPLEGVNEEAVTQELEQLSLSLKEKENSYAAVNAELLQDKKNRKQLQELKVSYDKKFKVVEEWSKLNSLIGSASGDRFMKIAQRHTLHILLLHANKQLSFLSKRYRLQQVPGSLALQVIDCDMCDEVRTVYSLSGGESFLISLALALGLSSLSSNNLKVESLFIDEGFGSLDSESLRTAMEALEQLQLQGRKIGVISHVQEMSERIAVQVKLEKGASGRSNLTITG